MLTFMNTVALAAGEYRARQEARRACASLLETRHARFSMIRLLLLASAVAFVAFVGWSALPYLVAWILAFVGVAFAHARALNERDRAIRAATFYARGLTRLEDRWQGTGDTGERFRRADHLYADDLDLFGEGSLFQLLSGPRTSGGEAVLAEWLMYPARPAEILERQQAVRELGPRLDLREDLAIIGPEVRSAVDTPALVAWAKAPVELTVRWPVVVLPLLATVSASLVAQWIWSGEPPDALGPALLVQTLVALWFRARVHQVAHGVERRAQELMVLGELLGRLEREPVSSPRLVHLSNRLSTGGRPPSEEIRRLARLVDLLSSRENQIFGPIAALLLLGTQLAFAVEQWRLRCGPQVETWLQVVSEFEALSAFAAYAGEHPRDPMPEVVDDYTHFLGEGLDHPLLGARSVPNDVRLGGDVFPHLLLVSGSNMSGKSTLLRTVGLNAVLAQAGAPVRATRLRMSPLAIGATLRVQDSLQAGQSRFYAEITRISQIVAAAKRADPPVLFLLDEVLAGTNSHDRQQGAQAIVHGLVRLGALGLVTTHDLALAALVQQEGARAENVHFADRFEGGRLFFDFRLKPGLVQSSNAIELMRSVGLDV